jgi:hypothetical protein
MPIENPGPGATGTGAGIVREQQHLLDTTPKETRQGWRDLIQVHPAAELFPMMSEDELRELGNDIEKNGLQHAVVFWTPTRREDLPYRGKNKGRPKQKYLLDGRNRLEAIQRTVTDPEERAEAIADAIYLDAYGYDGAKLLCANIDPFEY